MDHPLIDLINERIRQAEAEGTFDGLPGAGKPLPPCDDPENAVLNRILKDNGAVPEFVSLLRRMARLREDLADAADRTRRRDILAEMSILETRIEITRRDGRR